MLDFFYQVYILLEKQKSLVQIKILEPISALFL